MVETTHHQLAHTTSVHAGLPPRINCQPRESCGANGVEQRSAMVKLDRVSARMYGVVVALATALSTHCTMPQSVGVPVVLCPLT